eukprot:TRINITY_DN381_c1_g1_i1.p1 TRINITY_DN381_c1_g1~~TRINITY_DN381_c1_g1_i1.p1  ORF type:complete len:411 (-),score=145.92 TRINITY_DN381_c1_g1_i1:115-1347(-)
MDYFRLLSYAWSNPKDKTNITIENATQFSDRDFCFIILRKVSRSFAVVIEQLSEELRYPVCIFYLVLRALDTIEDDMKLENEKKLELLSVFHEKLHQVGWNVKGISGDAGESQYYYEMLLTHFDKVINEFKLLKKEYQETIADITQKMAGGMAEFVKKRVESLEDYDYYCYIVAGLVGIGLSRLFTATGLENYNVNDRDLSNSMGLFLQKTNITRDYNEDLRDGRIFWPTKIWSIYATNIGDLKNFPAEKRLPCLNHMIVNAMTHIFDCLEYQSRLKDINILRFCSIPQLMAMSTLSILYNNDNTFNQIVKMNRVQSVKIITSINDFESVLRWYNILLNEFKNKIPSNTNDELTENLREIIEKALVCVNNYGYKIGITSFETSKKNKLLPVTACIIIGSAVAAYTAMQFN